MFLFRSLVPLDNPIGFGALDFIELALALMLVALALTWRPWIAPFAARIARKPAWCLPILAALPVTLRLFLLANHPVPTPDLYDEFGHLLVADTLRHGRLANPPHAMHQFFETFFVLQQPTYSSIYPVGNGLALAVGWSALGLPWAGVLLGVAALCSLCYWMLRGWTTPGWALLGGVLAVFEFGPLNQWTNNYWGGALSAAAGCLVFGALPRLRNRPHWRDGVLLGLGLAIHVLTRPYESIFLFAGAALFLLPRFLPLPYGHGSVGLSAAAAALLVLLPAAGITLLQNKRVTGEWTTLPYALSQYQYGVPAALTFQQAPVPHLPLTPQQELDYRMQSNFHPGPETLASYTARLWFRIRYYRFYFYPPLYLALVAFLLGKRGYRWRWVALTCLLFALGINFFPAFQFHYLAAVVCLFLLMSVKGLERITRLPHGAEAARLIIFLCIAHFAFWYGIHFRDPGILSYDMWDSINHRNPERRIAVAKELAETPGKLLVLVRYWPQHIFQDEWVYNGADIDGQRIVWARDLGDAENKELEHYFGDRKYLLLEPDSRPPRLSPYHPEPGPEATPKSPETPQATPKHPLIELEQVETR
ncbi:MAG: hypothetical protein ABSB15_17055 [Bryobacteraceae bacterium]